MVKPIAWKRVNQIPGTIVCDQLQAAAVPWLLDQPARYVRSTIVGPVGLSAVGACPPHDGAG
jgi:hypothetical protein